MTMFDNSMISPNLCSYGRTRREMTFAHAINNTLRQFYISFKYLWSIVTVYDNLQQNFGCLRRDT